MELIPLLSKEEKERNHHNNEEVLALEKAWRAFYKYREELYTGNTLPHMEPESCCTICGQEMPKNTPENAGLGIHSYCTVPFEWIEWARAMHAGLV